SLLRQNDYLYNRRLPSPDHLHGGFPVTGKQYLLVGLAQACALVPLRSKRALNGGDQWGIPVIDSLPILPFTRINGRPLVFENAAVPCSRQIYFRLVEIVSPTILNARCPDGLEMAW